ncbi:MAG: hypothetical protein FWC57_04075 [Endomicrobia bacterium]|nr:hypothetical protein [Endomicrobiia bacterium]
MKTEKKKDQISKNKLPDFVIETIPDKKAEIKFTGIETAPPIPYILCTPQH